MHVYSSVMEIYDCKMQHFFTPHVYDVSDVIVWLRLCVCVCVCVLPLPLGMVATIPISSLIKYASNWSHIGWIINGCFNIIFATDIQLVPVRKIGLIIQGFPYTVFATDIQPITVRKIITFITESCFPEAYCHHKCPIGLPWPNRQTHGLEFWYVGQL